MANNVIIFSDNEEGIAPVVKHLLGEIGSLLQIKGYFIKQEQQELRYYQMKSQSHLLSVPQDIDSYRQDETIQAELKLINEISLFPNPDLYILNGIGDIECQSERFCRQLMTLFESRVPVIVCLNDKDTEAYKKLKDIAPFHFVDIIDNEQSETYAKLLTLLD